MTEEKTASAIALETAKEHKRGNDRVYQTTQGVRYIVKPVSEITITEAQAKVEMPRVPRVWIEEKDREEENPFHPDYLADLEKVQSKKATVMYDTIMILGVELVDGIPEDNSWLKQLKFMERRNLIDLSDFDLDDEDDLEFLYKKHFVFSGQDFLNLQHKVMVTEEDIAEAEKSFQGNQERNTDKRS